MSIQHPQIFSVMTKLPSQKSFLRPIEETCCTHGLRPTPQIVRLHDNSYVTVPVFDTKEMIISLLTDQLLMTDSNFAIKIQCTNRGG